MVQAPIPPFRRGWGPQDLLGTQSSPAPHDIGKSLAHHSGTNLCYRVGETVVYGVLCPEIPVAERWREKGWSILAGC